MPRRRDTPLSTIDLLYNVPNFAPGKLMSDSPLVIENLSFQYRTRPEPAIQNISLELKPGEMLLIAGSSGCGKTTLARCINGLAQGGGAKVPLMHKKNSNQRPHPHHRDSYRHDSMYGWMWRFEKQLAVTAPSRTRRKPIIACRMTMS